jgi:hypothetical protein
MRVQKVPCMLVCIMPSDPPEKLKRDDEARAREEDGETEENGALRPASEKIPEGGSDNLRRRADWFQKRTGGTP